MSNLINFGMNEKFAKEATAYPNLIPGRVMSQYRDLYRVVTDSGELLAQVSGKYAFSAKLAEDYPVVGDFVMLDRGTDDAGNGIIHFILTRKSAFRRKAAGASHDAQIVASNIDFVFICMSMDENYNLRRLERYLSVAWDSGATPVVILTKSDLCEHPDILYNEVLSVAIGADVHVTTSLDDSVSKCVHPYLKTGVTACFIGSSGVGKSTMINKLLGSDRIKTSETRQKDGRGRHTSTRREMLLLPNGGVVIDTPGMRELGIDSADISKSFADIDALVSKCRFTDCSHTNEPGCAVMAAIKNGELSTDRYESYLKIKQEAAYSSLNSRQIENEKITRMFGSKNEMKQMMKEIKKKNRR
ncbi:MAG: ribosome small subunit-dependent GTPase A [Monoglobales bacterium]